MTDSHFDKDCLFCKIVHGEIPAHIVYEDDEYLAFLDIFPRTKGDTLLIPKKHYRWTYDVPDFGGYWEKARDITQLLSDSLGSTWTNYFTFGGIPHAHIHIMPRYDEIQAEEEDHVIPSSHKASSEELQNTLADIKNHKDS